MTYRGSAALARRLTVRVKGSRDLDDERQLLEALQRSTGLAWRPESEPDEGHLSASIVEIVLVAVLGKTTELAYGAVVEKVHERLEQWRDRYLDKPEYEIAAEGVPEADGSDRDDGGDEGPESSGPET